ncbi:MAG: GNAT family N-acetyltransferase [Saprospiraceae bacterium]|nr:GNAT family N-acetyltransferase [Candidatus Brachybacter algidus]
MAKSSQHQIVPVRKSYCGVKSTSSAVRIYRNVDELPEAWNTILPLKHFLRTNTLLLAEKAALPDITHLYVGYFDGEKLIAVAYFQQLAVCRYHLNDENLPFITKTAWRTICGVLCPRLLVAGHLFHHEISTFHSRTNGAYESYTIYAAMMDACVQYSRAKALLIKDLPQNLVTHFQNLKPDFIRMPNDISMEMKVDPEWTSIKDYEKALKHKYAQRYRKVRSQMNGVSVSEMSLEEVIKHQDPIFKLYNQVANNQQVRLGYLSAAYLPMLKKSFEKAFRIWGFFKDGELIAFYSAWQYNGTLDMYYIGFDYESNKQHNLYFNMLFFGVETAIESRCKLLIMGRTALEAKARLGCEPKYLSTFLCISNSWIRRWFNSMSPRQEGEEWENRHPFLDKKGVVEAV